MKRPNAIPSQPLNVALPLPLYTKLGAHLYSELEGRVPHGAYSRFMIDLLQGYFSQRALDLAPFAGTQPGGAIVTGSPEAVAVLQRLLEQSGDKFAFTGSDADFASLSRLLGD